MQDDDAGEFVGEFTYDIMQENTLDKSEQNRKSCGNVRV